jgi:hypothetical protein
MSNGAFYLAAPEAYQILEHACAGHGAEVLADAVPHAIALCNYEFDGSTRDKSV